MKTRFNLLALTLCLMASFLLIAVNSSVANASTNHSWWNPQGWFNNKSETSRPSANKTLDLSQQAKRVEESKKALLKAEKEYGVFNTQAQRANDSLEKARQKKITAKAIFKTALDNLTEKQNQLASLNEKPKNSSQKRNLINPTASANQAGLMQDSLPKNWFKQSSQPGSTEKTDLANTTTHQNQSSDKNLLSMPLVETEKSVKSIPNINQSKQKLYEIKTEKGPIVIQLFNSEAPVTVSNFKELVSQGFYNRYNMKFHRVIPDFVVQTGDPTGTGAGGSKKTIPLEVKNKLSHNKKGIVAMARSADPNSASSQFYITLAPQRSLDGKYAIFGEVVSGLSVLDQIEKNDMLYGIEAVAKSAVPLEKEEKNQTGLFSRFF
ncbi:MAG: peptidylprolyl isomerase [Cyanobacteria bacterium P01_H01_bin.74]